MRNSVKSTLDLQPLQKEKISFDTHVEIKVLLYGWLKFGINVNI